MKAIQKFCFFSAATIGFYALFQWKKSDAKVQLISGYLRDHVQYHKDNNIPFGP